MTDDRRELVFVVADTTMQQVLQGFFCRAQFHRSLRCGAFAIDPRQNQDVFVASGQNDPGLYAQPEELVRPHLTTHRHAVIMVDADWQGSPGADQIRLNITARVARIWEPTELAVIVLEPEIEAWFWQPDSPHIAAAMNYRGHKPYREVLADAEYWPAGCQKPPRPKEALQYMRRAYRTDLSPAVLKRAAAQMSVDGCTDPAFRALRHTLRRWFPPKLP